MAIPFRSASILAVVWAFSACSEKPAEPVVAPPPEKLNPSFHVDLQKPAEAVHKSPVDEIANKQAQMKAAKEAQTLHHWLVAYTFDHGGNFPDDPKEMNGTGLYDEAVGAPILSNLLEYRGRGLASSDDANTLLFRYKAGEGHEVRVDLTGVCKVVPSSTPVPPAAGAEGSGK